MKRYYFIADDLDVVAVVERELLTNAIAAEQIHVLSLDDADAEQHHVHDVQSLMKKDVIHSAEIGALIGVAASIITITAAYLSGLAAKVGWLPFVFLAIVLLGFFTWEGGLVGIQTPNSRFRRFERALRAGAHVFFVDVDPAQGATVKQILAAHPQMRPAGIGASLPHWIVGLQHNTRRFFQWAP